MAIKSSLYGNIRVNGNRPSVNGSEKMRKPGLTGAPSKDDRNDYSKSDKKRKRVK